MNLYAYVGNDPVNFRDPMGLCSITVWGRFLHNEDWTEVILLDIWAERSGCDGAAGGGGFGSGDGGSGGPVGDGPMDEPDIVITGQRPPVRKISVEYKYIDRTALYKHFMEGNGETICLSRQQFGEIARNARPVGPMVRGKQYSRSAVSFYGSDLAYVYGGGTMIYDSKTGEAVGFQDVYDFDWASRSFGAEAATRMGSIGYLFGGTDFSYGYPCE